MVGALSLKAGKRGHMRMPKRVTPFPFGIPRNKSFLKKCVFEGRILFHGCVKVSYPSPSPRQEELRHCLHPELGEGNGVSLRSAAALCTILDQFQLEYIATACLNPPLNPKRASSRIILTIPETEWASLNQWESSPWLVVRYVQFKINLLLFKLPSCLGLLEEELTCCPREGWIWHVGPGYMLSHLKDTWGDNVVDCCDSLGKVLHIRILGEMVLSIRIFLIYIYIFWALRFVKPKMLFLWREAKRSPPGCEVQRW